MLRGKERTEEIRRNGAFKKETPLIRLFFKAPYRTYFYHIVYSNHTTLAVFLSNNARFLNSEIWNLKGVFVAIDSSRILSLNVLLHWLEVSTLNLSISGEYHSRTPVIFAAAKQEMAACNLLISKGVELKYSDMFGKVAIDYVTFDDKLRQAFHNAASRQLLREVNIADANTLRILLKRCYADPNFPDEHGNTALHKAAAAANVLAVYELLNACAKTQVLNDNDETPYDRVRFIVGKNADIIRHILLNPTVLARVT